MIEYVTFVNTIVFYIIRASTDNIFIYANTLGTGLNGYISMQLLTKTDIQSPGEWLLWLFTNLFTKLQIIIYRFFKARAQFSYGVTEINNFILYM
ncbi:hypothetical protein AWR38_06330 [Idiomarina sp. WRN-38]|nr:hypothetical protein AWR38_06330 [Idiomarina sp. WRN-38]